MAVMRAVGSGHLLPARANVREDECEYVIELDVADFLDDELTVEILGARVTVRGDQVREPGDDGAPLRLHGQLEESFRLPDDADAGRTTALYEHGTLEIRAPRFTLEARRVPIEHRSPYAGSSGAAAC
jgi:HSP20 family molecular chaperone IbpA